MNQARLLLYIWQLLCLRDISEVEVVSDVLGEWLLQLKDQTKH